MIKTKESPTFELINHAREKTKVKRERKKRSQLKMKRKCPTKQTSIKKEFQSKSKIGNNLQTGIPRVS